MPQMTGLLTPDGLISWKLSVAEQEPILVPALLGFAITKLSKSNLGKKRSIFIKKN
jgi:hypothetical protein